MLRRTRIVVTLGPATDAPGVVDALLAAGADVARINFSHAIADEPSRRIAAWKAASLRVGRTTAVLADLPGPKLRVEMATTAELVAGQEVIFTSGPQSPGVFSVTEPRCLADIGPGHRLLLDDGRLQLRATRIELGCVHAVVEVGGTLQPRKGLNLPDTPLSLPALTERDRLALVAAVSAGVDWIALSFVRGPEAAIAAREALRDLGADLPVLAKVERPEAVRRAEEVVAAFDGVMVARGDLGVELPLERVPGVQKRLIRLARAVGKPVITATDMLDSMRRSPRPTRAEASDVANAIADGTDAVMLSGETAAGQYPVEAVACMDKIARAAEADLEKSGYPPLLGPVESDPDDPITLSAVALAREVSADAIVTPTLSGRTARLVSRHRPQAALVAVAPADAIARRVVLCWGTQAVTMDADLPTGSDRMAGAVLAGFRSGALRAGQRVVVLAGHPVAGGPRLPTLRVARVGPQGECGEP